MKRFSLSGIMIPGIIFLVFLGGTVIAQPADPSSTLYQIAASAVFESGEYAEVITVNDLKNLGTQGIAGPEDLDGELIEVDGRVWRVTPDGTVSEPPGDMGVCFGNTIRFEPSISYSVNGTRDYETLLALVNESFPDHSIIYAYRIDGTFSKMKVRTIPEQKEPYPPLSAVIANQTIFDLSDVTGTISGFWSPEWIDGVNFIGFHQHFITDDHSSAGHVLDATAENVTVSIQPVYRYTIILSQGGGEKD
jgi:acetolactate decarboxylase